MRLHPAVTQVGRTSAQDDILGGYHYHIPANTHFLIGIHVIHRSEKYWPDPETFKPERFENLSKYFFPFTLALQPQELPNLPNLFTVANSHSQAS